MKSVTFLHGLCFSTCLQVLALTFFNDVLETVKKRYPFYQWNYMCVCVYIIFIIFLHIKFWQIACWGGKDLFVLQVRVHCHWKQNGTQGRNLDAGSVAKTVEEFTGFLTTSFSVCFLTQLSTNYPRGAWPSVLYSPTNPNQDNAWRVCLEVICWRDFINWV